MHMSSLCIFGASSTWGAWDLEKGGWANRLRLWIDERNLKGGFYLETYNLGVSGDTTTDLLERLDVELAAREPKLVVISLADNDSAYRGSPDNSLVPLEKTVANVHEIIKRVHKITSTVIWLGAKYVDESKTMPVSWIDLNYSNDVIARYDTEIQKAVEADGGLFVPMRDLLTDADLEDGLHPNAQGHQKIFDRVRNFLETKKLLEVGKAE